MHLLQRQGRAVRTAGRAVKTPRFPNWAVQGGWESQEKLQAGAGGTPGTKTQC